MEKRVRDHLTTVRLMFGMGLKLTKLAFISRGVPYSPPQIIHVSLISAKAAYGEYKTLTAILENLLVDALGPDERVANTLLVKNISQNEIFMRLEDFSLSTSRNVSITNTKDECP